MYGVECRAERRSHRSMFYMNIFECSAECRTQSSIFKVFMVLNPELNIDPTARYPILVFQKCKDECRSHGSQLKDCLVLNAEPNIEFTVRYSRCMFSNAELKVDPIAGYSSVFGAECRTERRSYISIFKVYMLMNAELNIAPAA